MRMSNLFKLVSENIKTYKVKECHTVYFCFRKAKSSSKQNKVINRNKKRHSYKKLCVFFYCVNLANLSKKCSINKKNVFWNVSNGKKCV